MMAQAQVGDPERGGRLFALAAGCGCHTADNGAVGAGGGKVPTPFGTFYGTNITPDRETGIGDWSDIEIAAAIRDGYARGKGVESPAMPYYWYAAMTDADVTDLIAYLRRLPPVRRENRPHEGELPMSRWAYCAWRLVFAPHVERPVEAPAETAARGRYLADHIAICGDCHTPRSRFGAPIQAAYLSGHAAGPEGAKVPNITPHSSAIGDWDEKDIVHLLRTGFTPEFDNVQGLMAEVVDGRGAGPGYKDADPEDLRAIAVHLRTVPAIDKQGSDQ